MLCVIITVTSLKSNTGATFVLYATKQIYKINIYIHLRKHSKVTNTVQPMFSYVTTISDIFGKLHKACETNDIQ